MNTPKVSIAVAIYNSERFLRQCVDSLVNQTLGEMEIILVSDASPDHSITIMQEYAQRYPDMVQICELPENKHLGGARKMGLAMASGEYFGYVDGDDYVDIDMYKQLYEFAQKEKLDLAESYYCNFDDEIGTKTVRTCSGGFSRIVRRELLIENEISFLDNLYADEYFWALVQCYAKKQALLPTPLYYSREQAGSIRHTVSNNTIIDRLGVKKVLLDELVRRGLEKKPFSQEIENNILQFHCLTTFYLFALSKKVDFQLISFYIRSCHELITEYFPNYKANTLLYSRIPVTEKFLLFTLDKGNGSAFVLTILCSTVLKWCRIAKRKVQSIIKKGRR